MSLEEMIDMIEETLALTESDTNASPGVLALAKSLRMSGVKVKIEPWRDGDLGVSIKHEPMKHLKGFDALKALDVTNLKRKGYKGAFTFKGNEYLVQPYKGYTFVMSLTD
jgi:hypothetical protein